MKPDMQKSRKPGRQRLLTLALFLALLSLAGLSPVTAFPIKLKMPSDDSVRIRPLSHETEIGSLGCTGRAVMASEGKNSYRGVYLNHLEANSQAMVAGLQPGDIIISVNGSPTTSITELGKRAEAGIQNARIEITFARRAGGRLRILSTSQAAATQPRNRNRLSRPNIQRAPQPLPQPRPEKIEVLEEKMRELLNKDRAKQKLGPLARSSNLTIIARAHSQDMVDRGFFSHQNPDGLMPADRVKRAGIRYSYVAENISTVNYDESFDEQVARSQKMLMKSKGHRKNILTPTLKTVGIGISYTEKGGIMVTQLFAADDIP